MSIQDWGAIGEIAGAIGVIVTLVYLARQIRQNTKTVSAQMVQSIGANTQGITLAPIQQPALSEALDIAAHGNELTDPQYALIEQYLFAIMRNWELNLYAKREGFDDAAMQESHEKGLRALLRQDYAATWWKNNKHQRFSQDFAKQIDEILSADA